MTELSRDKQIKEKEEREKAITQYIENNPKCKIEGRRQFVQYKNGQEPLPVYELPRNLLRKNPKNWRFRAQYEKIKLKRKAEGKSEELDIEDPNDVKVIENIINGTEPQNEWKQKKFNELKQNFKLKASDGSNGQDTDALIKWDGVYINGNRRDTILETLVNNPNELKDSNLNASQFKTIRVSRLPEDIDDIDIGNNEISEQVSHDSRERYSYTNQSLIISDQIEKIMEVHGVTKKQAISQVAKKAFAVSEKEVTEMYDYKKTVDALLVQMDRVGDYDYIENDEDSSEGSAGIVVILKELRRNKEKIKQQGRSGEETARLVKSLYQFAWLAKEKPKHRDPKTNKMKPMPHYSQQNWRKFCQTLQHKEAADKFLSSDVGEKIRWTKPQDNADEFASAIVRARNVKDKDDLVKNPLDELEKAEVALSKVEHAMNTTQATEIKKKIKNEGGEAVMKRIDSHIAVIKKKLKQN